MNRQRKVVITTTYNDLGIIVDTKAEELDLSTQPNLQPICNNLATDTISRQSAIDEIAKRMPHSYTPDGSHPADEKVYMAQEIYADCIETIEIMPSINPENTHDKTTDDLISRDEAIDDLHGKDPSRIWDTADIEVWVNGLPSVQPDHIAEVSKKDDENGDDLIRREDALMSLTGEWTESRDEILSKAIRRIKRLPSVQPEQNDAEFWRKRSDEYEKMFLDLYWRMMNGVKFDSMQFDENGITLKMKDPFREDNT